MLKFLVVTSILLSQIAHAEVLFTCTGKNGLGENKQISVIKEPAVTTLYLYDAGKIEVALDILFEVSVDPYSIQASRDLFSRDDLASTQATHDTTIVFAVPHGALNLPVGTHFRAQLEGREYKVIETFYKKHGRKYKKVPASEAPKYVMTDAGPATNGYLLEDASIRDLDCNRGDYQKP